MTPRVFGCTCFVQDLSPRSIKVSLLDIQERKKGNRCYNPSTRKYLMTADIIFFESVSYFSTQVPLTVSEIVPLSLSMSLPTPTSTIFHQYRQ